jgi:ABC-type nickel/cobalt efflux system permease component RcnA
MEKKKVSFFSTGLVHGLIAMLIGMIAGIALVSVIRLILGLQVIYTGEKQFYFHEAAWVLGGLFGAIAYMYGVGALAMDQMGAHRDTHPSGRRSELARMGVISTFMDHRRLASSTVSPHDHVRSPGCSR